MRKKLLFIIFCLSALTGFAQTANTHPQADDLKGKRIGVIGDSYVKNHKEPVENTWHYAFANAGVVFSDGGEVIGNVGLAVGLGLLLGKFLGIYLFTWLAIKSGLTRMPEGMNWKNIAGVSLLGGIGFTVSLFISNLSFSGAYPELLNQAKFGVLCGTIIAGILGYVVLNQVLPKKKKA